MDPEKEKLVKAYKHNVYEFKTPRYYDYPDGQDLGGKLIYTNKVMGAIGFFMGCARCLGYPPVKGLGRKVFVIARTTAPYLALANAFTLTTYHATNFRKVDDQFNHFLGGVAAGTTLGFITGKGIIGFMTAGMFGLLLSEFKRLKMMYGFVLPRPVEAEGFPSYFLRRKDFHFNDTRKPTWTKELPVENVN